MVGAPRELVSSSSIPIWMSSVCLSRKQWNARLFANAKTQEKPRLDSHPESCVLYVQYRNLSRCASSASKKKKIDMEKSGQGIVENNCRLVQSRSAWSYLSILGVLASCQFSLRVPGPRWVRPGGSGPNPTPHLT